MKTYSEILGVDQDAGFAEIKSAYRKKAKLYHPDISKLPDARERFIELNEAYEYLINRKKIYRKDESYNFTDDQWQIFIKSWKDIQEQKTRERAARHAQMKYSDFKKTPFYKTTQRLSAIYNFTNMALGSFIILMSILGILRDSKSLGTTAANFVNDFFIMSIGIVFLSFSLYRIISKADK